MISFIIPTFNEAENIEECILCIKYYTYKHLKHEIIVVDNGSTDNTVSIALRAGSTVITRPNITVGALRNQGWLHSKGDIIVFLDADVRISKEWGNHIKVVYNLLKKDPTIVTGSRCLGSKYPSRIEKAWVSGLVNSNNYINSGHMIVHQFLFGVIKFSTTLETGEDYEFCQRAIKEGARVISDPYLRVRHTRYPSSLREFFKRERRHGRGDANDLGTFLRSKPAILGVSQIVLFTISFINIKLFLLTLLSFVILWIALSIRHSKKYIIIRTTLYSIYLLARGVAIFDVLFSKLRKRRKDAIILENIN